MMLKEAENMNLVDLMMVKIDLLVGNLGIGLEQQVANMMVNLL
jgi:hypothetical protein